MKQGRKVEDSDVKKWDLDRVILERCVRGFEREKMEVGKDMDGSKSFKRVLMEDIWKALTGGRRRK